MDIRVKINPAYIRYLNKPQFNQIFFGGSSSGKSYFLAQKIVIDNLDGVNWLCCRNVAKTLRNSTFNEIKKSIYNMGVQSFYSINKSDMTITCKLNGKQIMFVGLDDPEKVKSITPANGILERIFIEEATEIKKDAYMQLKKRLRGQSNKSKHIFMAFNPILKTHWIYEKFFSYWEDNKNTYENDDCFIIKTTYKDNLFLTEQDRNLLENETDPYFYNVYSLGNWGVLGNIIFKNWRVEDLSEKIPHFDNIRYGLDVGYTNPCAFLKIHLDTERKKIYVLDEYYQSKMQDEDICEVAKKFFGKNCFMVDCAANQTIDYLIIHGLNAVKTTKGGESVLRGIRYLWGFEIIIDVRCQSFKNEIEAYHWQEDKYGNALESPVKTKDHLLDALRYACENDMLGATITAVKRAF